MTANSLGARWDRPVRTTTLDMILSMPRAVSSMVRINDDDFMSNVSTTETLLGQIK